jgi:hypothetical protein
MDHIIKTI